MSYFVVSETESHNVGLAGLGNYVSQDDLELTKNASDSQVLNLKTQASIQRVKGHWAKG